MLPAFVNARRKVGAPDVALLFAVSLRTRAARLEQRAAHVDRDRGRLIDAAAFLVDLLDDAHVRVGQRRQRDGRRCRRAIAFQGQILAPPRLDAAAQLGDRVRVPVHGGLELRNDLLLLLEVRLQRRDALLVGTQALDQGLPGLEVGAERFDLRVVLAFLAVVRLAQRPELRRGLRGLGFSFLQLRPELFDLAARLRPHAIYAVGIAAQRSDELLLAFELRAHALELEVARANLGAQLRRFLGVGAQRLDQRVLPLDALRQLLELAVFAGRALELGDPGALLLELLQDDRELGAPIGQEASQ